MSEPLGTDEMLDRIEELEAKLSKALGALDEAVSLLALEALDEAVCRIAPDDKDMMQKAGLDRIVATLAELTRTMTPERKKALHSLRNPNRKFVKS